MNSGITRRYSFRAVTALASASSSRPVTHTASQSASRLSSTWQENGTSIDRLRKPALSSEVYSTVSTTLPPMVSCWPAGCFSRSRSCPTVSTIRAMSGQYSGIAVSMDSS